MCYSANSVRENKDKYDVVVIGFTSRRLREAALATATGLQTPVFDCKRGQSTCD